MKVQNSVKIRCASCRVFYRYKKLNVRCFLSKHKQRQK